MSEYKGLTVEFRGDATSLSAALATIQRDASAAQSQLTGIDKALKNSSTNGRNLNNALRENRLSALGRDAQAAKERLTALKNVTPQLEANVKKATDKFKAMGTQEEYVANVTKKNTAAIAENNEKIAQAQKRMEGLKKRSSAYRGAAKEVEQLKDANKRLNDEIEAAAPHWNNMRQNVYDAQRALDKHNTSVLTSESNYKALSAEFDSASRIAAAANTKLVGFGDSLIKSGVGLQAVGKSISDIGDKLSLVSIMAAATFGRTIIGNAEDFGNKMAQVGVYLDTNAQGLSEMKDLAMQTGKETIFSAGEAAQAISELAKGGLTQAQIKAGALTSTMSLAAAGQLDLATAANVTVQAMKSFGIGAERSGEVADALAGVAAKSTAEVTDLSQGFVQVAAMAHNAGWSLQETSAAIGLMADRGYTGAMAGTALKVMLQRLTAPTDKARALMEELGIQVRDSNGHMKSASEVIDELNNAFYTFDENGNKVAKYSDDVRDAALSTMFGTRAINAALALMEGGSAAFDQYTAAASQAGSATKMAQGQLGELGWSFELLRGEAETAAVNVGEKLTPTIKGIVDAAEGTLEWFDDLDDSSQSLISHLGLMALAAGPLMSIGGRALTGLGKLGTTTGGFIKALGQMNTSLKTAPTAVHALGDAISAVNNINFSGAGGGLEKATSLVNGLKGGIKGLAVVGSVALIASIVSNLGEMAKREHDVTKATDGMSEAYENAMTTFGKSNDVIKSSVEASGWIRKDYDDAFSRMAQGVDKMRESAEGAATSISSLERAREAIEKYANSSRQLNNTEQGEFISAIKTVNELCGTQYQVVDSLTGKFADQNGVIQNNTDAINANIEARKKSIETESLEAQLKTAYDNRTEAAKTMASAQKDYNKALNDQTDAFVKNEAAMKRHHFYTREQAEEYVAASGGMAYYRDHLEDATSAYDAANDEIAQFNEALGASAAAASETADAYDMFVGKQAELIASSFEGTAKNMQTFKDQLRDVGADTERLGELSARELSELFTSYDGTVDGLVAVLKRLGVGFDEAGVEAAHAVDDMVNSLSGIDGAVQQVADSFNGISLREFAEKLHGAGVSVDDLKNLTTEDFAALVASSNGSIDEFIAKLSEMNEASNVQPEINATGNVTDGSAKESIDSTQASVDSMQGNWIGVYSSGNVPDGSAKVATDENQASVDAMQGNSIGVLALGNVPDGSAKTATDEAQGSISALANKDVDVNVHGNVLDGIASTIMGVADAIGRLVSKTVNVGVNYFTNGSAPNKAGGIRWHAAGAIVNAPHTGYPLDMVGEAGAEAIVPLTNRRYAQPFIDMIGDDIVSKLGMGAGSVTNIYFNGNRINDDPQIREVTKDYMMQLKRLGAM
jgi:TP901 family phage tail tape measure protein